MQQLCMVTLFVARWMLPWSANCSGLALINNSGCHDVGDNATAGSLEVIVTARGQSINDIMYRTWLLSLCI